MLQLLSSLSLLHFFIYLSFIPRGKGYDRLFIPFHTTIYCPTLHTLHTKLDINHDDMGPFMSTSRSPSFPIALTMLVLFIFESCVDSQLFLSDLIQITPPQWEAFGPQKLPRIDEGTCLQSGSSHTTLLSLQFVP
jgi:hypothetical protein